MTPPSDEPTVSDFSIVPNTVRKADILDMVRSALAADRMMLAFQPAVTTDEAVAFNEGLIRLRDTTGRIVPAGQFMDAVECEDLGREIDTAALRIGLETLANKPDLRLSINMSALSIRHRPWLETLERALADDAMVAERLILEITERCAMDAPVAIKTFMNELQDRGITFALDDFGAGQTSFRYLKQFDFDILKIDGSFIRDCDTDPDNQCIVSALLSVGHHFDMLTVAEAVETEAEAQFLIDAGADTLQGYYYGKPDVAPPWLETPEMAVRAAG